MRARGGRSPIGLGGAAALALAAVLRASPAASAPRPAGEVVPYFKATDLTGRAVNLGELLATKRVAVLFWDSRRATSVRLMNALDQIYGRYAKQGLEVLAVEGEGLPAERALERVEQLRGIGTAPAYTFVPDPGGKIARLFRVEETPQLFLVDRAGRLALHLEGFRSGDEVMLEDRVKQFLGLTPPPTQAPVPRAAEPRSAPAALPVAAARPEPSAREQEQALLEKYRYFGNFHLSRGEYAKAAEYYGKYLEIAPGDVTALLRLGEAYARQGLYDKAREAWEGVLRHDPGNAEADANIRSLIRGTF